MEKERHDALIQMYKKLDEAEERQKQRGVYDQGARSRVTSGKHLHPVTKVIKNDLISSGFYEDKVHYGDDIQSLIPRDYDAR